MNDKPEMTSFLKYCVLHVKNRIADPENQPANLLPQFAVYVEPPGEEPFTECMIFDSSFVADSDSKDKMAEAIRQYLRKYEGAVKEYCLMVEAWVSSPGTPEKWLKLAQSGFIAIADLPDSYKSEVVALNYSSFTSSGRENWAASTPFHRYPDGSFSSFGETQWHRQSADKKLYGRFADFC